MKKALIVVLSIGALVGTFTIGLYRGIDMGIEEYSKFHPLVIPVPCPEPAPTLFPHRS